MDRIREIRQLLRKITDVDLPPYTILTGQVTAVQAETCTILRNKLQFSNVRLGAVVDGNGNNVIIKPVIGSYVLLADLSDGKLRDLAVIGWSQIDTAALVVNGMTINGGQLGGLTKTLELKGQLETMSSRIDAIIDAIKNGVVVAQDGGASLKTTIVAALNAIANKENFSNIEDTKIKH